MARQKDSLICVDGGIEGYLRTEVANHWSTGRGRTKHRGKLLFVN